MAAGASAHHLLLRNVHAGLAQNVDLVRREGIGRRRNEELVDAAELDDNGSSACMASWLARLGLGRITTRSLKLTQDVFSMRGCTQSNNSCSIGSHKIPRQKTLMLAATMPRTVSEASAKTC